MIRGLSLKPYSEASPFEDKNKSSKAGTEAQASFAKVRTPPETNLWDPDRQKAFSEVWRTGSVGEYLTAGLAYSMSGAACLAPRAAYVSDSAV